MNNIILESLNKDNWFVITQLSVSEDQRSVFPISNAYWIGISRYEEMTELFAIKQGEDYVGLIGGGLDEDAVSGYINPLMIDEKYQRQGIAAAAILLIIEYLNRTFYVSKINIEHRKTNLAASKLYETLGFNIQSETENEILRTYHFKNILEEQIDEY